MLSVDGIGAFDLVSRQAASSFLWEDHDGVVHTIVQAEGGEQGDPLMPVLFALGQHPAFVTLQTQFQDDERLFAFLDDLYVVCSPDRVSAVNGVLQNALFHHSRIRVHHGKTQVWNREGVVRILGTPSDFRPRYPYFGHSSWPPGLCSCRVGFSV